MAILNVLIGSALDPFMNAAPAHPLQTRERISAIGHAPVDGRANVGTHDGTVNADDGVPLRRNIEPPECGPEQFAGGHEATNDIGTGNLKRVADQHGGPARVRPAEKEVETNAVGIGDPRHAVTTRRHVLILQLPLKDDLSVTGLHRRWRKTPTRCWSAWQRSDARPRTGDGQHEDRGDPATES